MPAAVSLQRNAPTIPSFIVVREALPVSRAVATSGSVLTQPAVFLELASAVCSMSLATPSRTVGIADVAP
jgi:hypothetical protein